eukprot:g24127.t1
MLAMMTVEPMFHCMGSSEEVFSFRCDGWTDQMSLAYEILVTFGVFLYVTLILEMGSISIKLSEYRVLVTHAIQQVILCLGVVFLIIFTFAVAISGMEREVAAVTAEGAIQGLAEQSPLLLIVVLLFMMMVYSFFFNLLVSQFCGVYTSLAADIKGHARLARGEIIIETFKAVKMTRWAKFMNSLNLDEKVDFEEGDIGLAGGIKNFEPALAHPVAKESLLLIHNSSGFFFQGLTFAGVGRTIQKTIQKSLHKMLGSGKKGGAGSVSTGLNSDQDTKLGEESTEESTGRFEVQRLGFREADELASEASEAAVEDERRDTDFDNLDDDVGSKAPSSAGQNSNFGETMRNLTLSSTEVNVLRQSFDMLLGAMGHDREAVGDAIYGTKIQALVAIKDHPWGARTHLDGLQVLLQVFTHETNAGILGREWYTSLMLQRRPIGRFVGDTYGERLRVIKEDWAAVQKSASEDHGEDEEAEEGEEGEKGEKVEKGAETFSFGRMCAFSNEVMGQKTEGWMEELLSECDLLAINLIVRSQSIDFEKFKPVMLAALRSLLPKQWSTLHETAWEWLWMTVSRNLRESTMKVRAFKPYNVKLFSALSEEQLDRFRKDIFTHFFVRAPASQDLFKQPGASR